MIVLALLPVIGPSAGKGVCIREYVTIRLPSCDRCPVPPCNFFLGLFGLGRNDSRYSRPRRIASRKAGSPANVPAIRFHQGVSSFELTTISFNFATSASKAATRSFSFIVFMADPFLPAGILHFYHTEYLAGHQRIVGMRFSFDK